MNDVPTASGAPVPPLNIAPSESTTAVSETVFRRRFRKFRRVKRGWYSLLVLLSCYILSFFAPLLISSNALLVKFDGKYFFPAFGNFHEAKEFGQRRIGSPDYRTLQATLREDGEDETWVLMPPYPYSPNESLLDEFDGNPPHPPSPVHWLGTDDRDRDVFARLVYGFWNSMTFALGVVGFAYTFGVAVGACFGFFGGRIDIYGQRVVEIWAALPFLYTVMIISSIVQPTLRLLVVLVGMFSWVGITYYMRGEFYREKSRDYVSAAIAQGESRSSIMFRHILPNALTPIISYAPFAIVGAITAIVSLDFLGFGLPAPAASWGELLEQGRGQLSSGGGASSSLFDYHLILAPVIALNLTLLMVVFIGEAVREAFDPKVFSRLR